MADIFISYARNDQPRVRPFIELLEQQGWSVWWDPEVTPGRSFGDEIDEEIAAASCMVVFWSRNSVDSNWVQAEANEGLERGILIPVLLDDVRLPLVFRRTETVPLYGWPANADAVQVRRVLDAIAARIGADPDAVRLDTVHKARGYGPLFALIAIVLVIGVGFAIELSDNPVQVERAHVGSAEDGRATPAASIAVVPFEGLEVDIAPELSRLLAASGAFSVESEDQVAAYRSDPDRITLDARYTVQGSAADGRLTVALLDRRNRATVWDRTVALGDQPLSALTQSIATQISGVFHKPAITVDAVSNDAYMTYLRARARLQQQNDLDGLKQAERLFLQTIETAPRFGEGWAGLCETYSFMYMETKDVEYFEDAERRCFRAATLSAGNARVDIALGRLYGLAGRYDAALEHLQSALQRTPFSTEVLRELAQVRYEQGDVAEAAELLTTAQEREPSYWKNYEDLATLYFETGRYMRAAEQYERMRKLVTDQSRVLNDLGSAYYLAEEFDKAIEAWRESLAIKETPPALSNLGSAYFFNGEYERAAEAYRKAIGLREDDARLWANAGDALAQTDEDAGPYFRRAAELARKQLEINPQDAGLLSLLSSSLAALGERAEATRFVDRALALANDDIYVLYDVAVALNRLGESKRRDDELARMAARGYSSTLIERDANFHQRRQK